MVLPSHLINCGGVLGSIIGREEWHKLCHNLDSPDGEQYLMMRNGDIVELLT